MTRPFNDLVKPGLEQEWKNDIFPKYFVRDATNISQARQPGLFKEEAVVNSGSMVALRKIVIFYQL